MSTEQKPPVYIIVAGWLCSGLLTLYEKPPRVRAKFPRFGQVVPGGGKVAAGRDPSMRNKEITG